ncbi:unnamed protein product [Pleuronectes platessa]|uniref:Uncharacterized protein n=1 Tax=Pleuronectes platessa TaxID=8262 RepID=A0A9N7VQB7_PLEPL|nr:unnamed protein product [Pleuronectes platessa]
MAKSSIDSTSSASAEALIPSCPKTPVAQSSDSEDLIERVIGDLNFKYRALLDATFTVCHPSLTMPRYHVGAFAPLKQLFSKDSSSEPERTQKSQTDNQME